MGTTKRICIVTLHQSTVWGGGAEHQIDYLLDVLVRSGRHELYYVARNTDDGRLERPYRVVRVGHSGATLKLGYGIDAVSLYRALSRIRPDTIYQRVACAYTGVCALYARRHGARLVWHVSSDSDVDKSRRLLGGPVARVIEQACVDYAIARADSIVVQTETQAALLAANYGRSADAVIANFHPEPAERIDKDGPPTVLWIANVKRWKRPEVFVRIAVALSDLADVRWLMVGAPAADPRDRQWSAELMGQIAAVPNLRFLGRRTQDDVNALLARSHLLVSTSEQEGFPNIFIQAWMREVPVVSLVDPDGVLTRQRIGIRASTDDELIAAVRSLLTDSATRRQYAERARRYALQQYSLRNAERLARLLVQDPSGKECDVEASLVTKARLESS